MFYCNLKISNEVYVLYNRRQNTIYILFKNINRPKRDLVIVIACNEQSYDEYTYVIYDFLASNNFGYRIPKKSINSMLRDFHEPRPQLSPSLVPLGGGQYHSFILLKETMTHSLLIWGFISVELFLIVLQLINAFSTFKPGCLTYAKLY